MSVKALTWDFAPIDERNARLHFDRINTLIDRLDETDNLKLRLDEIDELEAANPVYACLLPTD